MLRLINIGLIVIGLIPSSFAHHGTFSYDGETVITIEGVITRFNWTNPHSTVEILVSERGGVKRSFVVEADGPSLLGPIGVDKNSLSLGDSVIAFVSPSKRNNASSSQSHVLGREIIKHNGEVIALSVRYARQQEEEFNSSIADSIFGSWVPDRSALFTFVQNRASWLLTPKGQVAIQGYDVTAPFAHTECIAATAPTLMMYPTAKVITETKDVLTLNVDWMGAVRTVYMNGSSPIRMAPSQHGLSLGTWDGDELIIDTTKFTANPIGNAFGVPSSEEKHLVEHLSLSENGRELHYSFFLEDPEYLLEPVTGSYLWHYRPDVEASSIPCDVESAASHLSE